MRSPEAIKNGLACCAKASLEECDHCPYGNDCDIFEACNLYRDALAYITQLEARVPKWISVHDMEPADNTFAAVLVRNSENWGFSTFKIAAWVDGEWIGLCYPWKVTHWMPIPEMPKEE